MSRLIIPVPPSVNHAYRNYTTKRGQRRRVLTSEAESFKSEAGWSATAWRSQTRWVMPAEGTKIIMRVWCYWGSAQRRDTDNVLKLTQDSLTGILWVDDQWVLPQVIDFAVDRGKPRLEIELEVMVS